MVGPGGRRGVQGGGHWSPSSTTCHHVVGLNAVARPRGFGWRGPAGRCAGPRGRGWRGARSPTGNRRGPRGRPFPAGLVFAGEAGAKARHSDGRRSARRHPLLVGELDEVPGADGDLRLGGAVGVGRSSPSLRRPFAPRGTRLGRGLGEEAGSAGVADERRHRRRRPRQSRRMPSEPRGLVRTLSRASRSSPRQRQRDI